MVAENVSGTVYHDFRGKVKPQFGQKPTEIAIFSEMFRNMLQCCSMATQSRRKTIRQIADEAGVSVATVSRVLNGRDDVSDETRDLVSRIIRENGYTRADCRPAGPG